VHVKGVLFVPTVFTHAIVGLGLAATVGQIQSPLAISMSVSLAALPDCDVIGFYLGVPYGSPWGHRGVLPLPVLRRVGRSRGGPAYCCGAGHALVAAMGLLLRGYGLAQPPRRFHQRRQGRRLLRPLRREALVPALEADPCFVHWLEHFPQGDDLGPGERGLLGLAAISTTALRGQGLLWLSSSCLAVSCRSRCRLHVFRW
jgi:hypothetical protein